MRTASAAYIAAIATTDTEIVTQAIFTWPAALGIPATYVDLSKAVVSYSGQRDLTTDMPSVTRLTTGYPQATGTLTMSGRLYEAADETINAAWLFDPFSVSSPLYGLDWAGPKGVQVQILQGLRLLGVVQPEMFPIMTAWVSTQGPIVRETGDVQLGLIDNRSVISALPQLPLILASGAGQANYGFFIQPNLYASYFIDAIYRANGIYSGPPSRPNAESLFYMSGHGSGWPETMAVNGMINVYSTYDSVNPPPKPCIFGQGVWCGQSLMSPATVLFLMTDSVPELSGTFYWETGIVTGAPGATTTVLTTRFFDGGSNNDYVEIDVISSATGQIQVTVFVRRNNILTTLGPTAFSTAAAGNHTVGVQVTLGATTASAQVWLDRVAQTLLSATGLAGLSVGATGKMVQVEVFSGGTGAAAVVIDTMQATIGEATPGGPYAFTSGFSEFDASLNQMTATANYTDTDPWQLLQEIVEAEYASTGFDENNLAFFRNRKSVPALFQATASSLTNVKNLGIQTEEADRFRTINAQIHPLTIGTGQIVWTDSQIEFVPASGSLVVVASLSYPVYGVPVAFEYVPSGGIPPPYSINGYRASTKGDGSTGVPVTNLVITASQISSTAVSIRIKNPNAFPVFLCQPVTGGPTAAGTPVLQLVGQPVTEVAPTDTTTTSNSNLSSGVLLTETYLDGLPTLTLGDNIWRQDPVTTTALMVDLLGSGSRPKPRIQQFTIVGDARYQIGDRIRVTDAGERTTNGFGALAPMSDDIILTSIHPNIDEGSGFTQQVIGIFVANPRQWILGVPGRSELGSTTWI